MTSELGRSLRIGRGEKSQRKIAAELGFEISVITKLESGVFVPLDEEEISRLATVARMDPSVFKSMYEWEYKTELEAGRSPAPVHRDPLSIIAEKMSPLPAKDREEIIRTLELMVQAKLALSA